ncbi:MAG TPA: hypothetical protein PK514_01980 [Spirochaetota bacterium]|nr:hypothetical protein [Spirochaetota bacterium]
MRCSDEDTNSKRFITGFDHENYEDRVTYRINPELNGCIIDAEAFIKIYKTKPENSGA